MRLLPLALALLLLAACAGPSRAQHPDLPPAAVTLTGWQQGLDVALLDQRHGYGGLFYDRGLFRRYTYPMDHEFVIDLLTYRFPPEEDADWYAAPTAFRLLSGSVGTSRFASRSQFRARVPLTARHVVYLDGILREDLIAMRAFTRIGYGHRFAEHHEIGVHQTYGTYKPDLDFSVFYRYTLPSVGEMRLETTFLDVANNLIFDVLEVHPVQEDTIRSYRQRPLLLTAHLATTGQAGWRGELAAGWLPEVTARIRSSRRAERHYDWTQHARYAALLLEYGRDAVTAGTIYRNQRTSVSRNAPAESIHTSDYTSTQHAYSGTLYGLRRLEPWYAGLWLTLKRFTDRQYGSDYDLATLPEDLDYRETQLLVRAEVARRPAVRGVRTGLTFLQLGALDRKDYETLARSLKYFHNERNSRVVVHAGYQARPGTYVVVGAAYDVDGDSFYSDAPRRYDGGFGRVVVTW